MAFTVQDYQDLVRLLQEHPEWREELRRSLFSEDLLALPMIVRQLAEAQQRTEERLNILTQRVDALTQRVDALTQRVEALAEAQQRTEERLNALTQRVDALAEAQQRTEERLATLTDQVRVLAEGLQQLTDTVGRLKGQVLERTYTDRAGSYFGRLLRRVRVVEVHSLEDTLEAILTPEEFQELLPLDLLVSGRVRYAPETPEIWLAIEISSVIDRGDIERVVQRTRLLKKAGYRVIPVVAGEAVTEGGQELAQSYPVVLVQDGQIAFWEKAIAEWENIQLSVEG